MAATPQRTRQLLLKRCLAASEQNKWQEVLDLLHDDELLIDQPRLLHLGVVAAHEVGNQAALERIAAIATKSTLESKQRIVVFRSLVMAGNAAAAWAVLNAGTIEEGDTSFMKQASRALAIAKDPELRQQISAKIRLISKDGGAVKPVPSTFSFMKSSVPYGSRPLGTVEVTGSPTVHSKHVDGLNNACEVFKARLAPAPKHAVVEYHDVFVDRVGQIWNEEGAIISSVGHPVPSVSRNDVPTVELGFHAMSATRGIYHWLVDRVPLLAWMFQDGITLPTILLRDTAPKFERNTLDLLGLKGLEVQSVGDAVFVKRLLLSRVGFHGLVDWEPIAPVLDTLKAEALKLAQKENVELPKKVYISRRDAARRKLVNEEELETALAARGYVSVLLSEIPLWHQIALMSQADSIIAPHGAGLAHLMVAKRGCEVFEILPIRDGTYALRFNYARLSIALGHKYHAWLEPQPPTGDVWYTEIEAFLQYFDQRHPAQA